jgi:hypothetical protein
MTSTSLQHRRMSVWVAECTVCIAGVCAVGSKAVIGQSQTPGAWRFPGEVHLETRGSQRNGWHSGFGRSEYRAVDVDMYIIKNHHAISSGTPLEGRVVTLQEAKCDAYLLKPSCTATHACSKNHDAAHINMI